jgi:hypothetical protein
LDGSSSGGAIHRHPRASAPSARAIEPASENKELVTHMNTTLLPSRGSWLPILALLASGAGCSSGAAESTPGDDAKAPDTAGDVGTVADSAEAAVDASPEAIDASDAPVDTGPACDATVCGGACVDTSKDLTS